MSEEIEPEVALVRLHDRRGGSATLRGLVAAAVLLPLLSVACQQSLPSPSARPSASSTPTAPSPSNPATSPSGPADSVTPSAGSAGASPGPLGDVFIGLVEIAAEDPSPGGTYIVIENHGQAPADIGCWRLSTTTQEDLRIPAASTVPAGGGLRLFFDRGTVANPDRLTLRDDTGQVIDATPVLHDTANDDQLFSRVGGEWVLGRPLLPSPLVDGGSIGPGGC